jgi:hypothetical protein
MQDAALHSCISLLLTEVLPVLLIAVTAAVLLRKMMPRGETSGRKSPSRAKTDLSLLLDGDPEGERRPEKSPIREPQLC